jgi:hypothetical protein
LNISSDPALLLMSGTKAYYYIEFLAVVVAVVANERHFEIVKQRSVYGEAELVVMEKEPASLRTLERGKPFAVDATVDVLIR